MSEQKKGLQFYISFLYLQTEFLPERLSLADHIAVALPVGLATAQLSKEANTLRSQSSNDETHSFMHSPALVWPVSAVSLSIHS